MGRNLATATKHVARIAFVTTTTLASMAHAQSDDAGAVVETTATTTPVEPARSDGTETTVAAPGESGRASEEGVVEVVQTGGPRGNERVGIWWQPVSSLFWAFRFQFAISLGVQIPIAQQTELVIDGFFNIGSDRDVNLPATPIEEFVVGWLGSIGVMRLFGPWRQSGPFVEPKIVYAIRNIHESPSPSAVSSAPDNLEGEVGLGLDIGWQFASGPLLVALVVGGNLDWCFHCVEYPTIGMDTMGNDIHGRTRGGHIVPGVNLNLFRIGLLF